ncbi:hypothetical protein Tco_0155355 [Tanacetum coccineum]
MMRAFGRKCKKGKLLNLWELRERLDQSERILQVKILQSKEKCVGTTTNCGTKENNIMLRFIPDVGSIGLHKQFWMQDNSPPSTIQMITVENKTAPKVPTKRKNFYVSSDAMQKEANKKRSQKALVY